MRRHFCPAPSNVPSSSVSPRSGCCSWLRAASAEPENVGKPFAISRRDSRREKMVQVKIGDVAVGDGAPCYIVGEIGINHNGDLGTARRLIDVAAVGGGEGVK